MSRRQPPHSQGLHLSILTYALILVALTSTALAISVQYSFSEMDRLEKQVQTRARELANEEIRNALQSIDLSVGRYLATVAEWDEVRQQLADPRYYSYWIAYRARSGSDAPEYIRHLELFDTAGRSLSRNDVHTLYDSQMLEQGKLIKMPGTRIFQAVAPVRSGSGSGQPLGYVAVDVDLLRAVIELGLFRHVNPGSIDIDTPLQSLLTLDEVGQYMEYDLEPTHGVDQMRGLTDTLLRRLAALILIAAAIVFLITSALIVRPLRRLSSHIDQLREKRGGLLLSSLGTPLAVSELEKMRVSLNDYELELQDMHRNLDEKNRQLWSLAHLDPLTGVSNRRALEEDWAKVREEYRGCDLSVALVLFDCDHFKAINDTYGHQVGDQVIQGIAQAVQKALRRGDRLYRLGGDEFASMVLVDSSETAVRIARRCIQEVIHHDFREYGLLEPVRISVGLAYSDDLGKTSLEQLQLEADAAMYTAKRPGHDHLAVYHPQMSDKAHTLLSSRVITTVYEALEQPTRIQMHYQPIMSLSEARTSYYEALVRLPRGDELLMPSLIFPVVESNRLEREFDAAVLRSIETDLSSGRIPHGTGVSVNLSGPSLESKEVVSALEGLRQYLGRFTIILEITETLLITHMDEVSGALNELRESGFVIALDDFGSGYSSLMYLAQMPVDVVKFDISLTRALQRRGKQAAMVEDLVNMIRRAGYRVVAEGIEDAGQLQQVKQLGFHYAQGYFLGRPERFCLVSRIDTA